MKDLRGVERGTCTKCTCKAYELEKEATRSACSYCECPAPAHIEVLSTVSTNDSSFLDKTGSSLNSSNASDTIVIELQKSFVSELSDPAQNNEPSTDDIVDLFPKRFPKSVEIALATKTLKGTHKDIICQKVVDKLYEKGWDDNRCLQKAARGMEQRWSPFRCKVDPDAKALSEKLRRRRDRLNENKSRLFIFAQIGRTVQN